MTRTKIADLNERFDHGAVDRSVPANEIRRQLRTASVLRDRLDEFGGVILGDEVGSGKTFVTFALLAHFLTTSPRKGAIVLVPTAQLEEKWERQMQTYFRAAIRDKRTANRLEGRIQRADRYSLPRLRPNAVVIARHSLFSYQMSKYDVAAVVESYIRGLPSPRPFRRFMKACGLNPDEGVWPSWADQSILERDRRLLRPLDVVYQRYQGGERQLADATRRAVQRVRLEMGRRLLPNASLIVVDEAHNLRSTDSSVYRSLMHVLSGKFDALLFLTATPFQLGRSELRNVIEFFRHARGHEDVRGEFDRRLVALEQAMDRYIVALDAFAWQWKTLEPDEALAMVSACIGDSLHSDGKAVMDGGRFFRDCISAKNELRRTFRPFLIRSVRPRHHREHTGLPQDFAIPDPSRIPLALLDRMLFELYEERGRTFVASALLGACSSWEALFTSAVMTDSRKEGRSSRAQLRELQRRKATGPHPKVMTTVDECIRGALAGLKTLVFVERVETGRHLRDEIDRGLSVERRTQSGRRALQDRARFGWPSLRENYLQTVFPLAFGREPDLRRLRHFAREHRELFNEVDTGRGTPRDYSVEKRLWEHVYVRDAIEADRSWSRELGKELVAAVERIADRDFILNGLDLISGGPEAGLHGPSGRKRGEPREPVLSFARAVIPYPSPWKPHAAELASIPPDWRAEFVDLTAAAIARSHLRHDVERLSIDGDARRHFRSVARLLAEPESGWPERFTSLVRQFVDAARDPEEGAAALRVRDLMTGLRSEQRVQFVGPDTDQAARSRAIAGFNTPLYPDVVIATPVLAEGIDLHRSCRRIIHHDLPWNPAKLEQRTGRIDRVGSLSERLLLADRDAPLDVYLPFVSGTYDEFIFDRVMTRRREFRCLLGSRPEWTKDEFDPSESGRPIPEVLVDLLQVDLGP